MVDSESYAVQERELQKRLPNVSREVIRHFLVQVRPQLRGPRLDPRMCCSSPHPLSLSASASVKLELLSGARDVGVYTEEF